MASSDQRPHADVRLITKSQYDTLSPREQGYWVYMQGEWPGSELNGLTNPCPPNSSDRQLWDYGQALAVQAAQDSEE